MFCDGQTVLINEEQSMAVFVDLHVVAGADPSAVLDLFFFAGIEAAGAKRPADFIDVLGEAQNYGFCDSFFRMQKRAGFFAVTFDEQAHPLDGFFAGLIGQFFLLRAFGSQNSDR